jgi:hypothetical protein
VYDQGEPDVCCVVLIVVFGGGGGGERERDTHGAQEDMLQSFKSNTTYLICLLYCIYF